MRRNDGDPGPDILTVPAGDEAWVVLHCRPRCEKKLERYCSERQLPVYLPVIEKLHRYGGRERRFNVPLFRGYLFCVTPPAEKARLRQNQYVANLLEVCDQEQLVGQLRQIRVALQAGSRIEVMPYLEEGKMVRVTDGPLKGVEGIVARFKGETRVVINVDMIQQSVALEVDYSCLAPA